tara:strand:+ start:182 stop:313 length:132 start_codon:yes stop_codon:yes gene_type:complete
MEEPLCATIRNQTAVLEEIKIGLSAMERLENLVRLVKKNCNFD